MKEKILNFCKAQPVLIIAFLLAVLTMFLIPPDQKYLEYCNFTVLIELFSLMIAVAGLRNAGIFDKITEFLLRKAGTVRKLAVMLILICFCSAMLVTNDVALLTFVPLTILIFQKIPDEKARILTIVLETASANMGSMLTPVGNPQNLYLYDTYHLSIGQFIETMLPSGICSLIMLILLTFLLPERNCESSGSESIRINQKSAGIYGGLFLFCLLTVFRIVPDWICLLVTVILILLTDRNLFRKADYALLASFICFFIFVGNMARIEAVREFFSGILTGREVIVSILLSQVVSNVPAAVMLSGFTDNGTALLLGVNLGGLGTLIASMASLISYQCYRNAENAKPFRYLLTFTGISLIMLAGLLGMYFIIK